MRTYTNGQPESMSRCIVEVGKGKRARQCLRERGEGPHNQFCSHHAEIVRHGGHVEIPFCDEGIR